MDNMDVDTMFNMPGGDDFSDVTTVFRTAARGQLRSINEPQDFLCITLLCADKTWSLEVSYLPKALVCRMP
jgi:hypothetical protein